MILRKNIVSIPLLMLIASTSGENESNILSPCGDAFYHLDKYTCYGGSFLCPILDSGPTLKCGDACYLSSIYSCVGDQLVYPPTSATTAASTSASACPEEPTTFQLSSPPYENYFYSTCHSSTQVVVTSPTPSSNLTLIGPRLLIAWPGGNSGIVAYFAPQNGVNGSLALALSNFSAGAGLFTEIYHTASSSADEPITGISGLLTLDSSAFLTVAILGSIRTIRDFSEGPSILRPQIQEATKYDVHTDGSVALSRLWLDNVTTTTLSFSPYAGNGTCDVEVNGKLAFEAGVYRFNASLNYAQLNQLDALSVLNPSSQALIYRYPAQTSSLSFLSYSQKLLAGGWRFLTYFGRDSMISALLLQPVLSQGEGGAVEAVISSVLERLSSSGQVCHEETIGDYATWLNMQDNIVSTSPLCTYTMIDTDFYLPILTQTYFLTTPTGRSRTADFFAQNATLPFGNQGTPYANLSLRNAERIINLAAPFASPGGQTVQNLQHLESTQIVGQWRDSTYGIGGGRIPFDVNTSLMPAALRAIAALSEAGLYPSHPDWSDTAARYAQVWEDSTLAFFTLTLPAATARTLVASYASNTSFNGSNNTDDIVSDLTFYALALDGSDGQDQVRVMHTDVAFRLYLLNTTSSTQLTSFLSAVADSILLAYPAGLMTGVGLLVANPAYGGEEVYTANWTRSDYHGTVVWGWPMAMMGAGLARQLGRCAGVEGEAPGFCGGEVEMKVRRAYNVLWDVVAANEAQLSEEVWSWVYDVGRGFEVESLSQLSPTESDVVQLWSLAYLAVGRDEALR